MKQGLPDDKYEIIRELGTGGTSTVILARNKKINAFRAIKKIPKSLQNETCYYVEIYVLNSINIRGVPVVYDVEEDDDNWYIVEEFIDGINFDKYLISEDANVRVALEYVCEICRIIESLHSISSGEVIYGDLKPDNILISGNSVYIVDFGNCIIRDRFSGVKMATREYAAPEQIEGKQKGRWTDVYSIGVLLQKVYRRFSGEFEPYKDNILKIISICMAKEPKLRYPSAENVSIQIKNLLGNYKLEYALGMNIYVCGSRRFAGVSHLAIGLCKYLESISYEARYLERSSHSEIAEIADYVENFNIVDGLFEYKGCKMVPDYGDFVISEPSKDKYVNVYDCGEYSEELAKLNGKLVIILTDVKDYKNFVYGNCLGVRDNINVTYVGNFSTVKGLRELRKRYNIKIENMPYFDNPFILEGNQIIFYRKLIKDVFGNSLPRKGIFRRRGGLAEFG